MMNARAFKLLTSVIMFLHKLSCSSSLKCYKCASVHQPHVSGSHEKVLSCTDFNYSSVFETECKYSTYCRKKILELDVSEDKKVEAIERDCAPQKLQFQVLEDGKWKAKETIADSIYQPGCFIAESQGVKASSSSYCYCNSNLCNSVDSTHDGFPNLNTVILLLIHFFKFIMQS